MQRRNRFMNKQQLQATLENQKVAPRVSDPKKEKRDRTIRIRNFNYERLAKLGDISEDFDDALTKVLDHWDKTTKGKANE
jgi:hypothetical protein